MSFLIYTNSRWDVTVASFIVDVDISTPNEDNDDVEDPSGSEDLVDSHDEDVVEGRRLSDISKISIYCDEDQLVLLV
jgi:hypothetical protein